jgi:hypothetical protein
MSDQSAFTNGSLVLRLAAKDLYLHRQMMIAALVGGLVSLALASTSQFGYNVGSVAFITTMMAYAVILAMYNIAQERRERAALFVLSLPLSPQDYVRAKLLGTTLTFIIPWTVLTVGAVAHVWLTRLPDGFLPFTILLLVYFLCTFVIMMAVALIVSSEAKMTMAIVFTNMSVTLFMFGVARLDGIGGFEQRQTAVWGTSFFAVLVGELVVIAVAGAIPLYYHSRKRDFL